MNETNVAVALTLTFWAIVFLAWAVSPWWIVAGIGTALVGLLALRV